MCPADDSPIKWIYGRQIRRVRGAATGGLWKSTVGMANKRIPDSI